MRGEVQAEKNKERTDGTLNGATTKTAFERDGKTPAYLEEFDANGRRRSLTIFERGSRTQTDYYTPDSVNNEQIARTIKYWPNGGNGVKSEINFHYNQQETQIGWESKDYRNNGTLASSTCWRGEVKDENGRVVLPNYFSSTNYAENGRISEECITAGARTIKTSYEADGKTPRRVEKFERSGNSPFVGLNTIEEFAGGVRSARTIEEHLPNGRTTEKMHERYDASGRLQLRRYPKHDDRLNKDVTRTELYRAGAPASWVEQTKNENGRWFITRQGSVNADGSGTEVDFSFKHPKTSWLPWESAKPVTANEDIPDDAIVVPFQRALEKAMP